MLLPQTYCPTNRQTLTQAKDLLTQFSNSIQHGIPTGDFSAAARLQIGLETTLLTLETSINPFESELKLELQKQYNEQVEILTATGLLIESLPNCKLPGIIGIDGKEHLLPTFREVLFSMIEQHEVLSIKIRQGFSVFTVIPWALPIETLARAYETLIRKKHNARELLDSEGKPLPLNQQTPVWVWPDLLQVDKVYYNLKVFDKDPVKHQGQTKPQLLQAPGSGWQVQLVENLPHIPRAGQATTVGDGDHARPQLPTSITDADQTPFAEFLRDRNVTTPSPRDYLAWHLQETASLSSPYANETLPTLESWLMAAITHLFKTNQVLDDYQDGGSASWLPGCYTASDLLPYAFWNRVDQQADLGRRVPDYRGGNYGVRWAVGVQMS